MCKKGYTQNTYGGCDETKCDSSCKLCDGPAEDQCVECSEARKLEGGYCTCDKGSVENHKGRCVFPGLEYDGKHIGEDLCRNECHDSCKECVGPDDDECTVCGEELILRIDDDVLMLADDQDWGKCVSIKTRHYVEDGKASRCHPSCEECYGGQDNECSTCNEYAYIDASDNGSFCKCMAGYQYDTEGACANITNQICPPGS
jgi:hypothetical protein